MISYKNRDSRRVRLLKMPKNLQRLYKESKCKECSVAVTRMDFAKILGKFTKVKIKYESSSTPKAKRNTQQVTSPNTRLKSNENGMVLLHRNAYNEHPVQEITKKIKSNGPSTPRVLKNQVNNILKENNRLKRTPVARNRGSSNNNKIIVNSNLKQYGIIFINPSKINIHDYQNKLSLTELLPFISKDILPSEEWCIDYFPKEDEPKDDKVYDRIAAELEDLMYSEKPILKATPTENKPDDFPSILDILNDNTTENVQHENNQSNCTDFKSNLESSDVEAMLLGKSNEAKKESTPMEIDNSDVNNLIADVVKSNTVQEQSKPQDLCETDIMDNPHSPSILDETLQKGIEEHLPSDQADKVTSLQANVSKAENMSGDDAKTMELDVRKDENTELNENVSTALNKSTVTHVVFKKSQNGKCCKCVTCPKNLKYNIELEGKSVEFLGAPKLISSLEDLQVLLQIVEESDLDSLYVLH